MAYQAIPPVTGGQDAWAATHQAALKNLIPQIPTANFRFVKVGENAGGINFAAPAVDGGTNGGAYGVANNATWYRITSTVVTLPKTGRWAWAAQAKWPAPTAASVGHLGFVNSASSHVVTISTDNAQSATNFVGEIIGAGTTVISLSTAYDTSVHTVYCTFDLTTIRIYFDGALAGSTTTLTNLTDENMQLGSFATAALTPGVVVQRILYGYV